MAKLKDLKVNWLSLVKEPANGKGLTLKHAANQVASTFAFTKFEVTKTADANGSGAERMVAYGIVYSPDETDLQGDTADAVTIRRAAYEFMRDGRLKNIDQEHDFDPKQAVVVESWLVRKSDELFPGEPEGSWAVGIQIGDPEMWAALKSGELTGISLAGFAREEPAASDTRYTEKGAGMPEWFKRFAKSIGLKTETPKTPENPETGEDTMNDEDIGKLAKALAPMVAEQLKSDPPAPAATPAPADPAPAPAPAAPAAPSDPAPAPAPAADAAGDDAIAKAIAKAFDSDAVNTKIADAVAKAVAKGETESGDSAAKSEGSFV